MDFAPNASPSPEQNSTTQPQQPTEGAAPESAQDQIARDKETPFPSQRPDYLAKHNIKYEHHRSVDWSLFTPSMRHYAETKEINPSALLLYRMGDFFECFLAPAANACPNPPNQKHDENTLNFPRIALAPPSGSDREKLERQ